MVQDITAPIWRERIQLTQTVKDGWRVGEVTVEVTYQDGDTPKDADRVMRLADAVSRGQEVVADLNTSAEGVS